MSAPRAVDLLDGGDATVSLSTAAEVLGISRSHAYALADCGELGVEVLRLGRRRVVSARSLRRVVGLDDAEPQPLTHRVHQILLSAGGKGASVSAIGRSARAEQASVQDALGHLARAGQVVQAASGRWVAIRRATDIWVGVDADGREYVIRVVDLGQEPAG